MAEPGEEKPALRKKPPLDLALSGLLGKPSPCVWLNLTVPTDHEQFCHYTPAGATTPAQMSSFVFSAYPDPILRTYIAPQALHILTCIIFTTIILH